MTVLDDTLKGLTLGDPDGPLRFEETLDCQVPTFIDPRIDLIPNTGKGDATNKFKRLDYHVPFAMRADFRPDQWPKAFREKLGQNVRVNFDGLVLCSAYSVRAQGPCNNKAVNRTVFCRNHGGALHPADKKLSGVTKAPMPQDRIENLDRVQKFMQGFLKVEDLDDDEITKQFIRNNAGVEVRVRLLGVKFEQIIVKELHARLNRYLMSKTPRALEVLYEILDSDLVEPADRLKAVQMLTDRTMGKAADVLITHQSEEKPYEGIIKSISGGSREDYRKSVASVRVGVDSTNGILDVEEVDPEEPDSEDSEVEGFSYLVDGQGSTGVEGSTGLFSDQRDQNRRQSSVSNGNIDFANEAGDKKYDNSFLAESERKRKEAIEARERIKKARSRRFAKRAVGGITDNTEDGFLLEFIVIANPKSKMLGWYKMKIHTPDKITPSLLARVQANNARDLVDALAAPPAVDWGSKPLPVGPDQEK